MGKAVLNGEKVILNIKCDGVVGTLAVRMVPVRVSTAYQIS